MYDTIPEELRQLKNWGVYRLEDKDGKITKVPYRPDATNSWIKASSTNPNTWTSYDEALELVNHYDGLAFFFSDGYFGVDLDDCRYDINWYVNEEEPKGIVCEFVNGLNSYAEVSPSGNGVHIICRGTLPKGRRRKNKVEMYDSARFFTVTGNALNDAEIEDCTETIKPLYNKYLGGEEAYADAPNIREIIKWINELDGGKLSDLFNGKYENYYNSASEADLGFLSMIAHKCGYNQIIMDTVFRRSKLYREKWERDDYRINTLIKACSSDGYSIRIKPSNEPNKKLLAWTYDDTGNAHRLHDTYGGVIRYCYDFKKWLFYDEATNRWTRDGGDYVKRCMDKVIANIADETTEDQEALNKFIKQSRQSNKKNAGIKECEHLLAIDGDAFDKKPWLLNTQTKCLDLQNGILLNPDKEQYFMKATNAVYDSNAECPQWLKFLDEVFLSNQELIEFIQKALGYTLSGHTFEQCMFLLLGDGKNGKSVFIEVIRYILGDYAVNIDINSLMVKKFGNTASSDIARLQGARLVTAGENNDGTRLDEGLIKQMTGGDIMTARRLYENEFEFTPQFKIWLSTNHRPIIRGTDDGIWRRLVVIPFKFKVQKADKKLTIKLKEEKDGILRWILEGWKKYSKDGTLHLPQMLLDEVEDYKHEMNIIDVYLEDRTQDSTYVCTQASLLYADYVEWCKRTNNFCYSMAKFGREISKKYEKYKTNGIIMYRGIDFRRN